MFFTQMTVYKEIGACAALFIASRSYYELDTSRKYYSCSTRTGHGFVKSSPLQEAMHASESKAMVEAVEAKCIEYLDATK
jgi:hypothetical protein